MEVEAKAVGKKNGEAAVMVVLVPDVLVLFFRRRKKCAMQNSCLRVKISTLPLAPKEAVQQRVATCTVGMAGAERKETAPVRSMMRAGHAF